MNSARKQESLGWRHEGLAVLVFAGLAVLFTFPLVLHFSDKVVGDAGGTDLVGHLWYLWWLGESVFSGWNPYFPHVVLHPIGAADFLAKSGILFNTSLTLPFQPFTTLEGAYNGAVLFYFVFNGYGAWRVVRYLTRNSPAALLAGTAMMVSPFFLRELVQGRSAQYSMGWLLLALYFLLRAWREGGWRLTLPAGLFMALASYSYLGNAILLSLFGVLFVVHEFFFERLRLVDWRRYVGLAQAGAVYAVAVVPLVAVFVFQGSGGPPPPGTIVDFPLWGNPGGSFSVTETTILMTSVVPFGDRFPLFEMPLVLGLAALFALFFSPRASSLWGIAALFFLVLSFGPYLKLQGQGGVGTVPLPGLLFYKFFPFHARFRVAFRFLILFWVPLTIMAGIGFARILDLTTHLWPGKRRLAGVFAVALLGLLVVVPPAVRGLAFLPTRLATYPVIPRYFSETLAAEADQAFVGVPIETHKPSDEEERAAPQPRWQSLEMLYQTAHGKRMLSGLWVSVKPPEVYWAFRQQNSLIRNILAWQWGDSTSAEPVRVLDLEIMQKLGFTKIVVSNNWLTPENGIMVKHYLSQLFGSPVSYPDDNIDVYEVGTALEGGAKGPLIVLEPLHGKAQQPADGVLDQATHEDAVYRRLLADAASVECDLESLLELSRFYEAKGAVPLAVRAWRKAAELDPLVVVPEHLLLPSIRNPIRMGLPGDS